MNTTYAAHETIIMENTSEKKTRLSDIFSNVYIILHFVPILTTIAWIIYFIFGQNDAMMSVLGPIILIGSASAVITHPIKILLLVLKKVGGAFLAPVIGFPIFPFNLMVAALCGGIAVTIFLAMMIFAPAILPLYYFFTDN